MANYYVKSIEGQDAVTIQEVNNKTNSVNGSVLKTTGSVGIFNKRGNNFYLSGGVLNNAQGTVIGLDSSKNYVPTPSNVSTLIRNTKVRSVFNKFFNNSNAGSSTNFSNWDSATNLNAFAYMKSNGVEGNKFTAY